MESGVHGFVGVLTLESSNWRRAVGLALANPEAGLIHGFGIDAEVGSVSGGMIVRENRRFEIMSSFL